MAAVRKVERLRAADESVDALIEVLTATLSPETSPRQAMAANQSGVVSLLTPWVSGFLTSWVKVAEAVTGLRLLTVHTSNHRRRNAARPLNFAMEPIATVKPRQFCSGERLISPAPGPVIREKLRP